MIFKHVDGDPLEPLQRLLGVRGPHFKRNGIYFSAIYAKICTISNRNRIEISKSNRNRIGFDGKYRNRIESGKSDIEASLI